MLAIIEGKVSAGVQTEIGISIGLGKRVILARNALDEFAYFNSAIIRAGKANDTLLPLASDPFLH